MHMKLERNHTWRDLLTMPDDGVERWIEDGELKEIHPPEGHDEKCEASPPLSHGHSPDDDQWVD